MVKFNIKVVILVLLFLSLSNVFIENLAPTTDVHTGRPPGMASEAYTVHGKDKLLALEALRQKVLWKQIREREGLI